MHQRIKLLVFASLLAGFPVTSIPGQAVSAADDCLSEPNRQSPDGSHWYYRVERPSGRKCWYLGAQGEKVRSVARKPARRRMPVESPAANATSEPPASLPVAEQPPPVARVAAPPAEPAPQIAQAGPQIGQRIVQPKIENTVIASRWLDSPQGAGAADAGPAATDPSLAVPASAVEARDSAPANDPDHPAEAGSPEPQAASAIDPRPMLVLLAVALVLAASVVHLASRRSRRRAGVARHPSPPRESIVPILANASRPSTLGPRRLAPVAAPAGKSRVLVRSI